MARKNILHVNLRKIRLTNDEMTQQTLADLVGVTRQTIISIEKGRYSPSIVLALRIARVFHVPVEAIFTLREEGHEENEPITKQ
ncbi:MAG: helix-turn-helix transcriptional regulator [Spirochaetales bacterium]|nr:helix-turn-helix transcriptional regulator [Spirochaetales bacterium]